MDYRSDTDFIVKLIPNNPDDDIILARVKPLGTLHETVQHVMNRMSDENYECMNDGDTLQVPKLSVKVMHSFSKLLGKHLLCPGFEQHFIAEALQFIDFRLDEKGAKLKSWARLTIALGASDALRPKKLVFDAPFLIILKQQGSKHPYFALWIGNDTLLQRR